MIFSIFLYLKNSLNKIYLTQNGNEAINAYLLCDGGYRW